jgi:hypothetical protein
MYTAFLACPDSDHAVLAPLDHVAVLDPYMLNDCRRLVLFSLRDTGSALPLSRLELVVHLDNVLLSCAYNPSVVKRHACDGVVVSVSIKDGASPQIPYLENISQPQHFWEHQIMTVTHPYASVQASSNQVGVVKLQARHRPGMSD